MSTISGNGGYQRKRRAGAHCVPLSDETVELSECFNWSNKIGSNPLDLRKERNLSATH